MAEKDKDNPTWPYNQDIFPPSSICKAYSEFEPLVSNPAIARAFLGYEKQATRLKRRYIRLGKIALYCIAAVMILLAYRVTLPLAPFAAESHWVAAVLGVAGLVFLAIMYAGRIKNRWLLQRYAAERIRCLKFQAFFLLAEHDATTLPAAVDSFVDEGLGEISREVDGRQQFRGFSVSDVKLPHGATLAPWAAERASKAAALYDTLRFKWQRDHLEEQGKLSEGDLLAPSSIGNAAFLLGAVLAVLDLLTWIAVQLWPASHFDIPGLDFLTLLAFIVSATAAVFERGDANLAHADRYARYAAEIVRLRTRLEQGGELLGLVYEMERNSLLELRDFCRDIQQSTYIA